MVTQFVVEFLPPLFGKEDACALETNIPPRPRYDSGKPVGPFHVEIDVVRTPGDQRGRVQLLQLRLDSNGMGRIECAVRKCGLRYTSMVSSVTLSGCS
jgi:hypothetical protein